MKTPLATRVEAYRNERALSQKQLAACLHEHWPHASLSTLEAQLSKLLNGYAEGERLLDKPEVAQGLARMLGEEVERLQFLRGVPRLLLHPSVHLAQREALLRRAEELYQTSDWIREVEATEADLTGQGPHEAVRVIGFKNAAEKLGGAVLVIAAAGALSDDLAKLYGAANLELAFVEQHPRGPRIAGRDELLPLRPPGPPRLEDAEGRRLYHVPAMADQARAALASLEGAPPSYDVRDEWQRWETALTGSSPGGWDWQKNSRLLQRAKAVASCDEVPTFYAEEVLRWCGSKHALNTNRWLRTAPIELATLFLHEGRRALEKWSRDADYDFGMTTLWRHEGRWLAVGAGSDELRRSVLEHCPELEIELPDFAPRLSTLLRQRRNPWLLAHPRFDEFVAEVAKTHGVIVDPAVLQAWRAAEASHAAAGFEDYSFEPMASAPQAAFRERLRALLQRTFVLSERDAWIGFVLQAAQHAPLLVATDTEPGETNAVANLGGGHLLLLRLHDYPLDAATDAVRRLSGAEIQALLGTDSWRHVHLDGGDVHLQLIALDEVPLLEGTHAGQRRRQRAAETAARAASDDAWDDDD